MEPTPLRPLFRVGDVVSLTGETFAMTVTVVTSDQITCHWLTHSGVLEWGMFPWNALYRIKEHETNRQ